MCYDFKLYNVTRGVAGQGVPGSGPPSPSLVNPWDLFKSDEQIRWLTRPRGYAEFAGLDFAGLESRGPTIRGGIGWTGNLSVYIKHTHKNALF